ncbi:unnamed protein product [Moneuplotes crassus]|uniref:non-specific serine/threonine protein kinase n=1 Tax=Euplotes crassus TaxID=5936 RepID=A0AAD1Y7V7_EUPCR|nr:unnamed protein product [Moneuplotes crassus]
MCSANIFLNKDGTAKLGDLNVSKVAKAGLLSTQTGTPYYASPEVWKDKPYNSSSDIWSLGCVLYEMICLRPPFLANDMEELYEKVCKGKYPDIPDNYSFDLRRVLSLMLQVKPSRRPNTKELLQLNEVKNKIEELYFDVGEIPNSKMGIRNSLLNTIKMPKEFVDLTRKLPKPNYSCDRPIFKTRYPEFGTSDGRLMMSEDEDDVCNFQSIKGSSPRSKILKPLKKQSRKQGTRNRISLKDKKEIKKSMKNAKRVISRHMNHLPQISNDMTIAASYINSKDNYSNLNLPSLSQNNSKSRNSPSAKQSIDSTRKVYPCAPKNIINFKLKAKKRPQHKMPPSKNLNSRGSDGLQNSIFRNHRKRYSNRMGINLKSYKVNVYNIGINSTLNNSINNDSVSPRPNVSNQSLRSSKRSIQRPYYDILSRSALKNSLSGPNSPEASRLSKER